MADQEIFEEPNFVLQKGAMLPVARLAYKTVGALNAARDNAVLVPSWYTGTHNDRNIHAWRDAGTRPAAIFHHPDEFAGQRFVLIAQQHAGAI